MALRTDTKLFSWRNESDVSVYRDERVRISLEIKRKMKCHQGDADHAMVSSLFLLLFSTPPSHHRLIAVSLVLTVNILHMAAEEAVVRPVKHAFYKRRTTCHEADEVELLWRCGAGDVDVEVMSWR
ncbi:uncharacterized [Tachysurus ichikawai]